MLGQLYASAVAEHIATDRAMGDTNASYELVTAYAEAVLREEPQTVSDCRLMVVALLAELRFQVMDLRAGKVVTENMIDHLDSCRQAAESLYRCLDSNCIGDGPLPAPLTEWYKPQDATNPDGSARGGAK